jgi:hypothetical protein
MEIDYFYFNLYNDRLAKLKETLGDTAPDRAFDDVSRVSNHKTYQLNIFLNEDEEQEVLPYLPNCKAVLCSIRQFFIIFPTSVELILGDDLNIFLTQERADRIELSVAHVLISLTIIACGKR